MMASKNLKRSLLLLALFAFLLIFDYQGPVAEATPYIKADGSGDNVRGFAWSSFYGWIRLNDDNAGGPAYGVHVDEVSLELEGHAWSSNLGWISFEESANIPDTSFRSRCLRGTCANCSACFNFHGSYPFNSGGEFHGWAKVHNLSGNNGWISLNCLNTGNCATSNYRVYMDDVDVTADGQIFGHAWLSGLSQEWISFSGPNYSSWAEINRPPWPINLTAPNWGGTQPCDDTVLRAFLRWQFDDPDAGDIQSAYHVIVYDHGYDGLDPPSVFLDSGKCTIVQASQPLCFIDGSGINFQFPLTPDRGVNLDYGHVYSWSLQVWDNNDHYSPVVNFDISLPVVDHQRIGGETVAVTDTTFQVYYAEFPDPHDIAWYPDPFSYEEEVFLSSEDKALYYLEDVSQLCDILNCGWTWESVAPGNIVFRDSHLASTTVMMVNNTGGGNALRLWVKDIKYDYHSDYRCSTQTSFSPKRKLPGWVETR